MSPSDVKGAISRALTSVRQALRGKVLRADGTKQVILVQAQGLSGEPFNSTEFFQMPGFRGMPLAGMQPMIVPLHGTSAHAVIVAMSNGTAFITDLKDGEVAIFNENDGVANSLVLRNGKLAELTCDVLKITATTMIEIDTPLMKNTGDIKAGNISIQGHKHPGVQFGTAQTGTAV